jgi:4-amino-4-deoxy-L-arabinose transferase-like glycosyltransferase
VPPSLLHRLDHLSASLESRRLFWLLLFSFCYFLRVLPVAIRPLWYDELLTYNVATLPSVAQVWPKLVEGADLNPPLFHWITWLSMSLLGPSEFALRLPAMLGFLGMCICLFFFVARRAGATFGFSALLIPVLSGALEYATEARAYGVTLFFCSLALLAWQSATSAKSRRLLALAGFSGALAAALLSHCYAVLMLIPFGLAQLGRDWRARRLDVPLWIALCLPLAACLTYLPLLRTLSPYAVNVGLFRPTLYSPIEFYEFLLAPALAPLWLAGLALPFLQIWDLPVEEAPPDRSGTYLLAASFLLVPILAMLMAHFATKIYMHRYGLSAIFGVAVLLPLAVARWSRYNICIAAALAVLLTLGIVGQFTALLLRGFTRPAEARLNLEIHPELPLVVSSGLLFYPLNHYASPALLPRLYYLSDPQLAAKHTGTDSFDRGYPDLARIFPLRANLAQYRPFLAQHSHFLLYGLSKHEMDWLVPQLLSEGAQLRYLGQQREQFGPASLYEVQLPEVQFPANPR